LTPGQLPPTATATYDTCHVRHLPLPTTATQQSPPRTIASREAAASGILSVLHLLPLKLFEFQIDPEYYKISSSADHSTWIPFDEECRVDIITSSQTF